MKSAWILLVALVLSAGLQSAPAKQWVTVEEVRKDGGVDIYAHNRHPNAVHHVELSFPSLVNFKSNKTLPVRQVLKPGARTLLTRLFVRDSKRDARYKLQSRAGMGDPDAVHQKDAIYLLPWAHGKKQQVVQGWFGTFTHRGKRALDFDLKTGSAIHAAREGTVVRVKEDSNKGGPHKSFAPHSNVVEIMHVDGSWATYAHLKKNGALVKMGQKVKAGQKIALSGATGQAKGPHLHFSVQKAGWKEPETLATRFLHSNGKIEAVKEGAYLYALHPGGKPFKTVHASQIKEKDLERHRKKVSPGKGVEVRDEKVDDRVFLYVVNRSRQTQEVEFSFGRTKNVRASKKFPLKKTVPPLTELYLMSLKILPGGDAEYRSNIRYRPVAGVKGK